MLGTSAIRNLIREAKVAQMYSTIQTSNSVGMQTLDQNLTDLVRRNIISPAEARARPRSPKTSLAERPTPAHPTPAARAVPEQP
jgi:twitching motility protein PilT